jgi:hypothetical protein
MRLRSVQPYLCEIDIEHVGSRIPDRDQCSSTPIDHACADMGGTMLPGPPANFGRLLASETEKWGKVVKFANIKAE